MGRCATGQVILLLDVTQSAHQMQNAVKTLHVPSVQVDTAILTGPADTQLTAVTPTLTALILMGCATCPHLTHRITVLTVTMDSVQEVSVGREKNRT